MAKNKPSRIVSKKHVARLERERRQVAIITYTTIAIVSIVILLIAYGILNITVLQARQPVLEVNGDTIGTGEFQLRVRIYRQRKIGEYMQYDYFANAFGMDMSQQLQQIQLELMSTTAVGQSVLDGLIDILLIRQYAEANGIVISEEAIQREIEAQLGYFPLGTSTPEPTATIFSYPTFSATQQFLITPALTATPFPTLTSAPTVTQDPNIPTSTPMPTATPYTLEAFETEYADTLDNFREIGMDEEDFRQFFITDRLMREAVMTATTADMEPFAEQVWARHILVGDETVAQDLYQQLLDGADFGSLAVANSLDTGSGANGGDLGWFGRGQMIPEFETVAFSLEVGEISQPVQSQYGWHIVQVIGHEDRPLTADEFNQQRELRFQQWLGEQRAAAQIDTYDDRWKDRVPTEPDLQEAILSLQQQQAELQQTAQP
ncbi:MAG: peptidylprolyl isomerase [Chloroflexota bacterium]